MLYKRGQTWWVKFKSQGTVIARSAGTTVKREAAEFERELRRQVAKELHHERAGLPVTYTYGQALLKWINEGAPKGMWGPARNTRPHLDHIALHLVVPAAHEMKAQMLTDGRKAATVNRRLAVVRRILNIAYRDWGWLTEPLGQKVRLLSEKGMSREFFLSQDEVDHLIECMSHKDPVILEKARSVVRLAAYTGLRQGELLGLQPENWQKPYIVLSNKTKSGKPRTVPVIDELSPFVTLPFDLSVWNLRQCFEVGREAMGRPEIRFHDLRHTYASWLVGNPDVPLTVIRDLLGHSSLSVTSKYSHLRGQHVDLVEGALKRKPKGLQKGVTH